MGIAWRLGLVIAGLILMLSSVFAQTADFSVNKYWIEDSRIMVELAYSGNTPVFATVKLVLNYDTFSDEYEGAVYFNPGDIQVVYAPLTSGYLETVDVLVDSQLIETLYINKEISENEGVINITKTCEAIVGEECNILVEYNLGSLYKYGVARSYDGYNWVNDTYYAVSNLEYLNYSFVPENPGTLRLVFFASDEEGNNYTTTLYLPVSGVSEQSNEMYNLVSYATRGVSIWRDYLYNDDTDRTLIVTHVLSTQEAKIYLTDWIPLPTTGFNDVLVEPDPDSVNGRNVSFYLDLQPGQPVEIKYLVPGRVDPELVTKMPEPTIEFVSSPKSPEPITRTYNLDGIIVTRTLRYSPDFNLTLITTEISGLNDTKIYTILDEVPGQIANYSQLDIVPGPDRVISKSPVAIQWNISNATNFTFVYRIPGLVPASNLDLFDPPLISTYTPEKKEEAGWVELKKKPETSAITGLLTLVGEGSLVYASMVTIAGVLAILLIYLERRAVPEVVEFQEEDLILEDVM